MEALIDCIDEIALDGLDGCPIQELWKHLEERTPPFSLKLDDATKQFLWKGIVQTPEVEFFVLAEPLAHLFRAECDSSTDKNKLKPDNPLDQFQGHLKDSNEFKLVSEQRIRGSCPSYFVRKNVSQDIQGQAEYLHLEAVYQRWGDCLVMVASQELREKALFGVNRDPNISIVDMQYCLLEHIAQSRYNGRLQHLIGSNYVKIESKTIFHHLKRLRQLHLITIQPVVITTLDPSKPVLSMGVRNLNTNIVRLKRFHVQQHHKYDVLAANLCKMLLDTPNQELPLIAVLKHFNESKKTVKKVRQFLQQAGYVVEEKMASETDNEECCPPKAKKANKKKKESSKGTSVYMIKVRLIKPFVLKTDSIWQPGDDDEEEEDDDDNDYDDDDDDEDGDREKDACGDDQYSNLIAERPLLNQVYGVILQTGSHGCTLKHCQRLCRLPFADVRVFVRNLKKKKLVQEVHQDIARAKITWIVATPFIEANTLTVKVKQVQDQLKQMETKAADSHTLEGTPRESPQPSPIPSPAPLESRDSKGKKPLKSKSVIAERVTYRKLKRKQMILEYLQNTKVVEGIYPFQKAIIASEEEEGYEGRIDRKVLIRLLDDLSAEGLIRQLKTVIHHGTVSQTVDLFLHSSITNDHLDVARTLEQCRVRIRDESYKAAEKQEKARQNAEEKEQRKLEKKAKVVEEKEKMKLEKKERDILRKAQQKHENEALKKKHKEQMAATTLEYKVSTHNYGFLPRFPRIQVMHELVWKLVYGDVIQETDAVGSSQIEESFVHNDECLKNLKPLAKVHDADGQPLQGWFRFRDLFTVMPLIILCKTIDIADKIEGLDEYALDPVKKYTLICDLPQPLRGRINEYRKVKSAPLDLLSNMAQMGLITPSLPFPTCFRDVKMFVKKGIKLLDTTISLPAWHTTCPPPGKTFPSHTHMFTSMAALQSYWSDLKCVCLNTPLGVLRNQGGSNVTVPLDSRYRRLTFFAKEEVDENSIDLPFGDHLGAGGLDRGLFGHVQKNWTRLMTKSPLSPQAVVQEKRKLPTTTGIIAAEAHVVNSGSVLPKDGEKRFLSVGRAETRKQAKKGNLKQQKKKRKAEDSEEIKEVKKTRTNLSEKGKSSVQKEDKKAHLNKTGHLNAIDEEDRNILARKVAERISFSAEEDSWLLLFRIALGIMKNDTSRFYPFVCMRNILHKTCAASLDKTAPNIQRRILKLMKIPQSQMTVKICAVECAHDESFQGFDDPNAEFEGTIKEVVNRLRQKFSSSSLSCDGDLTLVSSKQELHDKYKVQALVSKDTCLSDQNIVSLGPVIQSVADINKAAIRDQIQIAFTTPRELYDAYRVFQMFNSFTREELQYVFKDMQTKNLVSRKKSFENPTSQLTRSLPFASLTYQLSSVYHRLFQQGFKLVTFYRDCAKFWIQLINGKEHTLNDPITTATASSCSSQETLDILTQGTIEVKAKNTCGGDVACILSLLATNKVSVEVCIPDEILNLDPSEQNTDTQEQTSLETSDDFPSIQLPAKAPCEERSNLSLQKKRAPDTNEVPKRKENASENSKEKSQLSPSTAVPQRKSSTAVQSPSLINEKKPTERCQPSNVIPSCKSKPHGKGKTRAAPSMTEKEAEKREVLILNLPLSTVTKFTSAYDLTSVKESGDYLTSCTEAVEVEPKTAQVREAVPTVPGTSLTYNSTSSRSSRTALMLARGGKDPYVSINQLPARAFNTHDFMTLYHCKNVLRLKDTSDDKVQNATESDEERIAEGVLVTKPGVRLTSTIEKRLGRTVALSQDATDAVSPTSSDAILDDTVTSPMIVSVALSIEEYLEQGKREFGFNEMDAMLARYIHNIVDEHKEFGFPVVRLQERIRESHEQELNSSQYSFKEHVKYLCAAKLLYKVGVCEVSLVTASFVKPWCVTLLKPKSSSKASKPGKDVGDKSDSLRSKNTELGNDRSNQERETESSNSNNGLEITEIIRKETTSEISQFGSHVITECSSSSSLDADTTHRKNNGDTTKDTNDQTDMAFKAVDDLSSKQLEESEVQRKKSKVRNFERYSVVCRPWITIDGTTSQQLLRMFREMVLLLILDNPGIPEAQIAKHVFEALRPAALHDILESLILDECIVKHVLKLPPEMSLFGASKPAEPTKTVTFYTPTVDCILRLATSKRTGYT